MPKFFKKGSLRTREVENIEEADTVEMTVGDYRNLHDMLKGKDQEIANLQARLKNLETNYQKELKKLQAGYEKEIGEKDRQIAELEKRVDNFKEAVGRWKEKATGNAELNTDLVYFEFGSKQKGRKKVKVQRQKYKLPLPEHTDRQKAYELALNERENFGEDWELEKIDWNPKFGWNVTFMLEKGEDKSG